MPQAGFNTVIQVFERTMKIPVLYHGDIKNGLIETTASKNRPKYYESEAITRTKTHPIYMVRYKKFPPLK
jgi:hypothetical protein